MCVIIVTYTHFNSFDIVPYYINRMNKFNNSYDNIFFSNMDIENETCYIYDDNLPFSKEYSRLLNLIDDEFVIYSQEDQILYNGINPIVLEDIKQYLKNSNYNYCRLIRQQNELDTVINKLYRSNDKFSMQPTIWKRESLIKIMDSVVVDKIFDEYKFDNVMYKYPGLFYYNSETKRGIDHYDSSIWPYIATAIVKGKWNVSEYPLEIKNLFFEYDIKTKREFT